MILDALNLYGLCIKIGRRKSGSYSLAFGLLPHTVIQGILLFRHLGNFLLLSADLVDTDLFDFSGIQENRKWPVPAQMH